MEVLSNEEMREAITQMMAQGKYIRRIDDGTVRCRLSD